MNTILVAVASVATQIAVVYFGIHQFNLPYWSMMAAVVATTVLTSVLSRTIVPPSTVVREVQKRLTAHQSVESTVEMTLLDVLSLIGIVVTAYLLWTRYGALQWFGIYIVSTIAAVLAYMFL